MRPWVAVILCAARPLFGGEPLLDVEGHELRDEFLGRRRDVLPGRFVELVLGSLDLGLDDALAISRVPEGRITRQQDVEDDAAGPHINFFTVALAREDLGRQITGRATDRL